MQVDEFPTPATINTRSQTCVGVRPRRETAQTIVLGGWNPCARIAHDQFHLVRSARAGGSVDAEKL